MPFVGAEQMSVQRVLGLRGNEAVCHQVSTLRTLAKIWCGCVHACACMYVCVCIYACVCACMYVRVHVCMCACTYVCVCVHVCMCTAQSPLLVPTLFLKQSMCRDLSLCIFKILWVAFPLVFSIELIFLCVTVMDSCLRRCLWVFAVHW